MRPFFVLDISNKNLVISRLYFLPTSTLKKTPVQNFEMLFVYAKTMLHYTG